MKGFIKRVIKNKKIIKKFIEQKHKEGKTIFLYGASTKGNTVLQYYKLDKKTFCLAVSLYPSPRRRCNIGWCNGWWGCMIRFGTTYRTSIVSQTVAKHCTLHSSYCTTHTALFVLVKANVVQRWRNIYWALQILSLSLFDYFWNIIVCIKKTCSKNTFMFYVLPQIAQLCGKNELCS